MPVESVAAAGATGVMVSDRDATWEAWRPRASLGDLLRSHPIVVAIGGESDGAAGVRVAAALDRRYRSGVAAIHVLDVSDLPLFTSLPDAVTFTREPFSEGRFSEDARALRRRGPFARAGTHERRGTARAR
jgi:hypothetical protein